MKQWYVAYTKSRGEKKLALELAQIGITAYCPTKIEQRKWSDRIKKVEIPLFTSYCFIKTDEYSLDKVYALRNFSRFVYWQGTPAIVREQEIQQIKDFIAAYENSIEINTGDKLNVLSGPLEGTTGTVEKKEGKYIYLYLEQLNFCLRANVEETILSKV